MRKRSILHVSAAQSVPASGSLEYTWTQPEDGKIYLEEVYLAYDSVLQADGTFTLDIAGTSAADAIDSPNSNSSFGFANMKTPMRKGAKIRAYVSNANATTAGEYQLMVHAYEEEFSIEEILIDIAKLVRSILGRR